MPGSPAPRLVGTLIACALALSASPAFAQSIKDSLAPDGGTGAGGRRTVTFPALPRTGGSGSSGSGALGNFRPLVSLEVEKIQAVDGDVEADKKFTGLMLALGGRYTFMIPDVRKVHPFVRGKLRGGAVGEKFSTFSVSGDSGATHYEGIVHAGLDMRLGILQLEPFVGGAINHFKPEWKTAPTGTNLDAGQETQLQYGFTVALLFTESFGLGMNFFWKKGQFQTGTYQRAELGTSSVVFFWEHRTKSSGKNDLGPKDSLGTALAVSMPQADVYGFSVYF